MSRLCTKYKTNVLNFSISGKDIQSATTSFALSKKYIKNMVKGCWINILYRRILIDKDYFKEKSYKGISYVSHKTTGNVHRLINNFFIWVKAFNDAIDKGYIKCVYIYFIDPETEEVLEDYKFAFKYSNGEQKGSVSHDEVSEATKKMLTACEALGEYKKYPDNIKLEIEFVYWNDTPLDYEPPLFERALNPIRYQNQEMKSGKSIHLGQVDTSFHTMTCRARGKVFCFSRCVTPAPSSQVFVEMNDSNDFNINLNAIEKHVVTEDMETQIFPLNSENFNTDNAVVDYNTNWKKNKPKERDTIESESVHYKTSKESNLNSSVITLNNESELNNTLASDGSVVVNFPKLNCVCQFKIMHAQIETGTCTKCDVEYHLPCLHYLEAAHIEGPFVCHKCGNSTDELLNKLSEHDKSKLCRLRFFMALMLKTNKVPLSLIKQLCGDKSSEMLQHLFKLNFVKKDEKKYVVHEEASSRRKTFFYVPTNSQVLPNTEEFLRTSVTKKTKASNDSNFDSLKNTTKRAKRQRKLY